jgi:hypothetical protein
MRRFEVVRGAYLLDPFDFFDDLYVSYVCLAGVIFVTESKATLPEELFALSLGFAKSSGAFGAWLTACDVWVGKVKDRLDVGENILILRLLRGREDGKRKESSRMWD